MRLARGYFTQLGLLVFKLRLSLNHSSKAEKYQLISMTDFLVKHNKQGYLFDTGGVCSIKGPKFIGKYPFVPIADANVELKLPKIEVVQLHHAEVIGGTNFILLDGYIIYPDEFIPERDVCPAELNGIAKINLDSKTISITRGKAKHVDTAISLLGSCTGNYSHWLTETLPKILFADQVADFKDYPILVDAWIHPNFIESLMLLNKNQRQIIKVKRWERYKTNSLVDISPSAYVPPELRYYLKNKLLKAPRSDYFTFSKFALNELRKEIFNALNLHQNLNASYPKKIFLTRSRESTGNSRIVINIDEVERELVKYGYSSIDPAKLSFSQQVMLFSNAEKIVSPLGAALANTIFSNEKCKIIGLSPYYENANYYFFSNFMGALNHEIYYVLGLQISRGGHLLHKDFKINIDALVEALDFFEKI